MYWMLDINCCSNNKLFWWLRLTSAGWNIKSSPHRARFKKYGGTVTDRWVSLPSFSHANGSSVAQMMTGENGVVTGNLPSSFFNSWTVIDSCVFGVFSPQRGFAKANRKSDRKADLYATETGRALPLIGLHYVHIWQWEFSLTSWWIRRERNFFLVVRDTQDLFFYWKRSGVFVCPLKSSFRRTHARTTLASFSVWCWCECNVIGRNK